MLTAAAPVAAQQYEYVVTGTVIDAIGNSIPLVNIRLKGTVVGTATDVEGEYELRIRIDAPTAVLVFSSIGYRTKEVEVDGSDVYNVVLDEDLLGFDEIVVTGTSGGTQKKQLGNSISTVSANSLRDAMALDVTAAISGKIAGAQVKVTSGAPAGAISVTLRGTSTINSRAEPLYIIDGVIVDNSSNELVLVGSGGVQNRLVDLNPNDIERIEILKGAAAAAIYGSRASNGVVQIFTKRGRSGAPRVTWRSNVLVNSIRQKLPVNTAPFRWADPSDNANLERIPTERFDYQDYIYRTGTGTENYLSVSGGSGTTSYFVSGSNFYNEGFVRNSDFNRTTVRANLDQILNNWSVLKIGSAFTRSFANDIPTGGTSFFDGAVTTLQFSPHETDAFPDELGNYSSIGNAFFGNPNEIVDQYQYTQEVNRYTGSVSLVLTPTSQWSIDAVAGYDGYSHVARGFKPVGTVSTPNGFSRRGDLNTTLVNADVNTQYRLPLTESISSNTGAGFTYQYSKSETIINQAGNLGPIVETVDGGTITSSSDVISERSVTGAYLQETIGLNDRIFVTVAGRVDGSSVFGEDENTQFYPKAGGSWILSEEGFWPKSAIGEMKIRTSYGQSGNLTGIGPFERFTNYNPVPFLGETGLVPSPRLGDESIKPETQTEIEFGFDMAFLNRKVGIEFTYYDQKITDLLLQRVLSPSTGATSRIENVGELTNRGIEALIKATAIEKPGMGLRFFATFFKNSNEITKLDGPKFPIGNGNFSRQWAIEGQPLGIFYRAAYARADDGELLLTQPGPGGLPAALPQRERGNQAVYDSCVLGEAFAGTGSPDCSGAIPGAMRDENGQPVGTPLLVVLGDANPDWVGSFITEFDFKNLGFRFQFDAVQGQDVFNWNRRNFDRHNYRGGEDYGRELVDNPDRPKGWANASGSGLIDEEYIEDGSFVKLREVMLRYTFIRPFGWMRELEIRVAGRNLISFDSYRGYDPEISIAGRDTGVGGFDFGAVPIPRTFVFGFTMNL